MKTPFLRPAFPLLLLAGAALLIGCSSTQPTHFYLVTPIAATGAAVETGTETGGPALGVGPLVLAEYLDRPQIVSRITANELKLAEFHQWAEPLKDSILRILTVNLSRLLRSDRIVPFPWKGYDATTLRVMVEITCFERNPGGTLLLEARWTLVDELSRKPVAMRRSIIREPAGADEDYPAVTIAMSAALAKLAAEIADAVNERRTPPQ